MESHLQGAAHVSPLPEEDLAEVEDIIEAARGASGYVPTSLRLMARRPKLLRAFRALFSEIMPAPSTIPMQAKWLLAHAVSTSAGCRYCQAHTAANGNKAGLASEKAAALLEFETNPLFDARERALIGFGLAAGSVPNAVECSHFDALRAHFSNDEIIELGAVVALFGWLNRWNDTFASDLEAAPRAFAAAHLSARGWEVGKHAPPGDGSSGDRAPPEKRR